MFETSRGLTLLRFEELGEEMKGIIITTDGVCERRT